MSVRRPGFTQPPSRAATGFSSLLIESDDLNLYITANTYGWQGGCTIWVWSWDSNGTAVLVGIVINEEPDGEEVGLAPSGSGWAEIRDSKGELLSKSEVINWQ